MLKVKFEDPEYGFIGLKINCGEEELYILGSYCPRNSLADLVETLIGLLQLPMDCVVIWNEEPIEYEMRFSRVGQLITLTIDCYPDSTRSIYNYDRVLEISGSYEMTCIPFWRALRDLQGRFSYQDLTKRWLSPFPSLQLDQLSVTINSRKSSNFVEN